MAMVSVTPMIAESELVTPSMLRPSVISFDIMYGTMAPTVPAAILAFNRCLPGSSTDAESSIPINTMYSQHHTGFSRCLPCSSTDDESSLPINTMYSQHQTGLNLNKLPTKLHCY